MRMIRFLSTAAAIGAVATIALFTFILSAPSLADDAGKLLIVGEQYAPFEFKVENEITGIDVEIANRIFKRMGVEFQIKILQWDVAWKMIEKGEADAVFSTSRKKAREPFLYYPKEDMWVSEYVFFVRKDKKREKFNGYEDAKKHVVGIIKGNSYHDSFWSAGLNTVDGKGIDDNFKKLAKGEIDIFPCDKIVGGYSLQLLKLQDEISYYDTILFSKGYPMPFAKNSKHPRLKQISEQFEKELIKMKQSGEHDEIITEWMMAISEE